MSYAAIILIGAGFLALVLLVLFELAQILGEGGLKLLFWPRLNHGYEVAPVARLAVAPWVLLLFVLAGNGACIMLFGHDLLGRRETNYTPWLVAALVPVLMVHLIDYQRSVAAAVASLVLLSAGAGYTLYALDAWTWLPVVAPFLLWSLNGVRALHADKVMG
ncbi:MAG TPA: hypothetical protein VFY87_15350 [Geminicoccaceae bacterium]|jgi:hypothetical protein|nr:hypothetical protein [Geminicoccaceae bacterium]